MFLIWRNTCCSILGAKTSLYAEDLQITTEEQLCIFVWMYVYLPEIKSICFLFFSLCPNFCLGRLFRDFQPSRHFIFFVGFFLEPYTVYTLAGQEYDAASRIVLLQEFPIDGTNPQAVCIHNFMFLIWRNTCGSILGAKTSLYAEDLQITTEEQLCIFVWMYVYLPFGLMKTSLYRLELGL
ncbi:hypothetical protein H5410_056245 [Solanum commersonii]|uniref:Uncharacterized protein n=1 Tax=Solanum commersonii TaxID=4109 RepID=A0A9J5WLK3_SOLCO|nr:hypothetical protein H5410_056245 [Solanum commersonii]